MRSVLNIQQNNVSVSTFMSKTFEQRHIIQPQQLADVYVVWQNGQFIRRIFEEKVVFSKRRGVEELETLPLFSSFTKQHLNNNKESHTNLIFRHYGHVNLKQSDVCRQMWEIIEQMNIKLPAPSIGICEQSCENLIW